VATRLRSSVVASVVATGFLLARAARADDPCTDDVKRFCGDVLVGGGRVQNCLRQNAERLSPACRAKQAAAEELIRDFVRQFAVACQRDADRLCSEVKPGKGRILACLLRQQDDLSLSCRGQVDRYQAAAETVSTVRAACKADLERLCSGEPLTTEAVVECLQSHRDEISGTCRSVDPALGVRAAEIVDAVEALTSQERAQSVLQILQGIESIVFSRSQILFQFDSFQNLGGVANANRILFNPQVVFGPHNEFAVQLRAPVLTVYPNAQGRTAQTGLGAVTTAFAWGFFGTTRLHQYLSLALQWKSTAEAPIGAAWALTPSYAISVGLARWLAVTGQFAWTRSFASDGYPELNLLLAEPIVVVYLPVRSFVALDTKLGWSFVGNTFIPLMKGVAGIYMNRQRSLSISAWYQASLSKPAEAQTFDFGVGTALAYFFDW
jgi:hypothetical protein